MAAVSSAPKPDGWGRPELGVDLRGHFVPPADRRIEELQDSLQKKDADLRAMEERYRRYVDKARTVRMLSGLLPPFGSGLPQFAHLCPTPMPVIPHWGQTFIP